MLRPKLSRPRILRTTAARLALRYVLVYAVVLGLASATVLWTVARQVDDELRHELATELNSLRDLHTSGGIEALSAALPSPLVRGRLGKKRALYLLENRRGRRIAGNLLGGPDEDEVPADGKVHTAWIDEEDLPRGKFDDDAFLPFIAHEFDDGTRLLLGRGVEQAEDLQELAEFLVEGFGMALVLALLISFTLGHRILKRMDAISRTAEEIMAGDLSQRVPVSNKDDEFDALAIRLNAMLDRVQQLIKGMREVTDNVAHDLRSPLTRLRNRLEVTLLEHRSEETYRAAINQSIDDADGLIKTFNALLAVAQTEAGSHRTEWGPVDLNQLAEDLADLYGPLAEEKRQRLDFDHNSDATINGSRHLLAQALGNLIENAIKYTPENGRISLSVKHQTGYVDITVSDNGPGIPEADHKRVFERFVRLEDSRHTPGNGLGLSLVKAVCAMHKANLKLSDNNPGLRVDIRFPAAQATRSKTDN